MDQRGTGSCQDDVMQMRSLGVDGIWIFGDTGGTTSLLVSELSEVQGVFDAKAEHWGSGPLRRQTFFRRVRIRRRLYRVVYG